MLTRKTRKLLEKTIRYICNLEDKLIKEDGERRDIVDLMNKIKLAIRTFLNSEE